MRRGQPFTLTLHFHSRNYEPGFDSLHLVAETGKGGRGDPRPGIPAGFPAEESCCFPTETQPEGLLLTAGHSSWGTGSPSTSPRQSPPPCGPSGTKAASADGRLGPEVCVGVVGSDSQWMVPPPHVKPPGRVSPRSRERRLPTRGRALPRRSRGNGADSKLSRLHRSCRKASGARCATVSVEGEREACSGTGGGDYLVSMARTWLCAPKARTRGSLEPKLYGRAGRISHPRLAGRRPCRGIWSGSLGGDGTGDHRGLKGVHARWTHSPTAAPKSPPSDNTGVACHPNASPRIAE